MFVLGGDNPLKPLGNSSEPNLCLRLTADDGGIGFEQTWKASRPLGYHASPLIHRGHVYLTTRSGVLHCFTGMALCRVVAKK